VRVRSQERVGITLAHHLMLVAKFLFVLVVRPVLIHTGVYIARMMLAGSYSPNKISAMILHPAVIRPEKIANMMTTIPAIASRVMTNTFSPNRHTSIGL
jgi:hypothetical protein